jgi:hypothetical protein
MNGTGTSSDEIVRYLDRVRAALVDLPASKRDELLEDLPAHLAEVAAEAPGTLEERLGAPERYAADLRAAAGLVADAGAQRWPRPTLLLAVLGWLRRADAALGPVLGYRRASEFLRLLRPAWWVLRGYAAALLLVHLLGLESNGLLPRVYGNTLSGIVIAGLFAVGSIWLGHGSARAGNGARALLGLLNVVLALAGFVLLAQQDQNLRAELRATPSQSPWEVATDLYPYGPDGRPLSGVRLFDQYGQPMRIGDPMRCGRLRVEVPEYPLCAQPPYPYASVAPSPGATGASVSPTP